jgi:transposase
VDTHRDTLAAAAVTTVGAVLAHTDAPQANASSRSVVPNGPSVLARKTDSLDAVRAAREALTSEQLIHPRRRGEREALRVLLTTRHSAVLAAAAAINHLKALIVSAPEQRDAQRRIKRALARTILSDPPRHLQTRIDRG